MFGGAAGWLVMGALSAQAATEQEILASVAEFASHRTERLAEAPPVVPDEEYAKVARGEIITGLQSVEGYSAKKAYGVGVLGVGIAAAWAAVNDELALVDYTKVTYSEILYGKPCVSGRAVLQFLPVPLIADRWWITHLTANTALAEKSGGALRELAWTSTVDPAAITSAAGKEMIAEGTPIAFTKGGWLFGRIDDATTLIEYYVWTDPGGRVPAGPASMFAAGSITDTLEAVEGLAKAGTTSCPIR